MKTAEVALPATKSHGSLPDEDTIPSVQPKTIKALTSLSLKRTFDMFVGNHSQKFPLDEDAQRIKITSKMMDEYSTLEGFYTPRQPTTRNDGAPRLSADRRIESKSESSKLIDALATQRSQQQASHDNHSHAQAPRHVDNQLVVAGAPFQGHTKHLSGRVTAAGKAALTGTIMIPTAAGGEKEYTPSAAIAKRMPSKWPRPSWHAPWKTYRVISGHLGWVRSIAFDPGNEWFVTGSGDRTIKVWDLASGQLKLTLTGHIEQVTGLAISDRSPYMFSCGLDKLVKCWDLEQNKVIRNYHGHLSGVYSIALHPTQDILATGGRDSTCRIWDIRSRMQIFALSGHDDTVAAILTQGTDPQIITGSHDKTIKLWDLRMGKVMSTLTYHKKSVRALSAHPTEHTFVSGAADNIKKFKLPEGEFLHNMLQHQRAIVNALAVNEDGVLASGGDDGSLWFWDWKSGNAFQQGETIAQPGSLDSEAGIYAMSFDRSGTRLITCEADKTIKMWKENDYATPETHPVVFQPPKDIKRW